MRYESYAFLWMPRPERAIPPDMLGYYEQKGMDAQLKKNGTGTILNVTPERKLKVMRRENTEHKLWSPSEHTIAPFLNLPGTGWYVFVAELLHSKVKGLRDINYINDLLVRDGEYLVGTTFADRQKMLTELFPDVVPSMDGNYDVIDEHTWLARTYQPGANYRKLFDNLTRPDDEGLVLKDPKAKLALCLRENSNSAWQRKCRKPHANYGF